MIPADAGAVLAQIGERGCDLRVDLSSLSSVARVMAGIEPVIMLQKAEYAALVAERDGLRGKVEAVRALHTDADGECSVCVGPDRLVVLWDGDEETQQWVRDPVIWPCPTIAALAGGEG